MAGLPFVGRVQEQAFLTNALLSVAAGPQVVFVLGEAGAGKTTLVEQFVAGLNDDAVIVLRGGAVPVVDRAVPFGPVVQILRAFRARTGSSSFDECCGAARWLIAPLLPEIDAEVSDRMAGTELVADAVVGVLARAASAKPVVVVLDDLHWADPATVDVVGHAARALGAASVLVVVTAREDDLDDRVRSWMKELARIPHVRELSLPGFREAEIGALLAASGAPDDPQRIARLVARSGGNPLFASALIEAGDDAEAPESVLGFLRHRLRLLTEPGRAVALALAVGGGELEHRVLEQVCGDNRDFRAGFSELRQRDLVVVNDERCRLHHDLLREAVLAEALPMDIRRAHADVAATLEETTGLGLGGLARIAGHWAAAGERARHRAAALRAARAAMAAGAHEDASDWWHAIPITSGDPSDAELLEEAARACALAGRAQCAVVHLETALQAVTSDEERWRRQVDLASYLDKRGAEGAAIVQLGEVIAAAPDDSPSLRRALALRSQTQGWNRYAPARADVERAIDLADRYGDDDLLLVALPAYAQVLQSDGEEPAPTFARARRLALDRGDVVAAVRVVRSEANAALLDDRPGDALASALEAARTEAPVSTYDRLLNLGIAVWAAVDSLDLETATKLAETFPFVDNFGWAARIRPMCLASLALVQGRYDEARSHLDLADTFEIDPDDDWAVTELVLVQARLALAQGDVDAARASLLAVESSAKPVALGLQSEYVLELVRCLGLQRQRGGPDETAWLDTLLEKIEFEPFSDLWRQAIDAERSTAAGHNDTSAFADAALAFTERQSLSQAGRLRKRAIETALIAGERAHAQSLLDELQEWSSSLGFIEIVDGVADLARRAGLRQPAPVARSSHALTERELAVLEGLGERLSNREIANRLFIGVRTVETYVSSVLSKLGAPDRREAVAVAKQRGLLG